MTPWPDICGTTASMQTCCRRRERQRTIHNASACRKRTRSSVGRYRSHWLDGDGRAVSARPPICRSAATSRCAASGLARASPQAMMRISTLDRSPGIATEGRNKGADAVACTFRRLWRGAQNGQLHSFGQAEARERRAGRQLMAPRRLAELAHAGVRRLWRCRASAGPPASDAPCRE